MKSSERKELCLIYNYAQHYRTNIFTLMDKELHCDFVFGNDMGENVKKMDYSLLSNHVEVCNKRIFSHFYYQKGVVSLLKKYKKLFMLGDVYCLSTWLMVLLAPFYGTKIYFWSHAWYGKESFFIKLLKKLYFKRTAGMFLYGEYAKGLMLKEGFKKENLHVIYNSLDYDHQIKIRETLRPTDIYEKHFNNSNVNLFFVGRLTPIKRLDLLLDSVKMLKDKSVNVNLTFIGDGEMKQSLQEKVYTLGLNDKVWFYGPCYDEKTLSELIYNADLCVSPGNVGLTAMHSMVFGTPVITHDDFAWQMPEFEAIQKGSTGDFFKAGDIESLSRSIEQWIKTNKCNRAVIRNNCYKVIDEKYNPHYQLKVMKKYL